jgi:integrase
MSQNFPREYIPATLREAKHWYIEFGWYDDNLKPHRVRKYIHCAIKHLPSVKDRRSYAHELCFQINTRLRQGWIPGGPEPAPAPAPAPIVYAAPLPAPALQPTTITQLGHTPWAKVVDVYRTSLQKLEDADLLRKHTKNSYNSYINMLDTWVSQNPPKFREICEFTTDMVRSFLDWTINERGVSLTTRDYYLGWLRTFGGWLVDTGHLPTNPSAGLKRIVSNKRKKEAAKQAVGKYYISKIDRERIFSYLYDHDKWLLLVCYFLYYLFIRPKEISYLRVKYIYLQQQLMLIPAEISKNRTDAFVTIPKVVIDLMLELDLLSKPGDYFIFARGMRPGLHWVRADQFRDLWVELRDKLGLPESAKLYNLKHTGITDMTDVMPEKLVQQQARHWSVTMTERYIQKRMANATPEIKNYK